MANQEQLEILKQGVEAWNKWRSEAPIKNDPYFIDPAEEEIRIDLREADLSAEVLWGVNFRGVDLREANLQGTWLSFFDGSMASDLEGADLRGVVLFDAHLPFVNLREANLGNADLGNADLRGADLSGANLSKANLRGAKLEDANLTSVDLSEVYLAHVDLCGANLSRALLRKTNFASARIGSTNFGNIILDGATELEGINHFGPSTIGMDTIAKSNGKIPEVFLRGCGLSDWEIAAVKLYAPYLRNDEFIDVQNRIFDLRNRQALQISPLFISYSHTDSNFVDKIGACFAEKGVRYWRDIHEMKAGRIETQIDRAINLNSTVLLVLSENSLNSDWVEHEVRTARELEKELGRDTLCPVALDDSWKSSPWPKRVMEQVMEYNILDFSEWQDDSKFEGMFRRLIDGLELFYKG